MLTPCHPIPGLYGDGRHAYLVDDFGDSVPLQGLDDHAFESWCERVSLQMFEEH